MSEVCRLTSFLNVVPIMHLDNSQGPLSLEWNISWAGVRTTNLWITSRMLSPLRTSTECSLEWNSKIASNWYVRKCAVWLSFWNYTPAGACICSQSSEVTEGWPPSLAYIYVSVHCQWLVHMCWDHPKITSKKGPTTPGLTIICPNI